MFATATFRKAVLAMTIVPTLVLGITAAETAFTDVGAYAQTNVSPTAYSPNDRGKETSRPTNLGGGEGNNVWARPKLPPCPPTLTHVSDNCRPWTPPRRKFSSMEDCDCEFITKAGRKVRDCYVLINEKVQYCINDRSKKF